MSLLSWSCIISCLITSHLYFFDLPLPLLEPSITNLSHLRNGASVHLLYTCLNHLSIDACILSSIETPPSLSQISSFLILSLLVCPHIHFSILIFTTFTFGTWEFWLANNPFHRSVELAFRFWWHLLITRTSSEKSSICGNYIFTSAIYNMK